MAKPQGYVIYKGPSRINGQPIVAIATGFARPSRNPKTGPMIQTWILRSRVRPVDAVNRSGDEAICGSCPLRGNRGCYVGVGRAPESVWNTWRNGGYFDATSARTSHIVGLMSSHKIRLGSYGDPAAVPMSAWRPWVSGSRMHSGYTHQWREVRFAFLKRWVMASVETVADQEIAIADGWRTFRSTLDDVVLPNEIRCPASAEMGFTRDCYSCGACNGNANGGDRRSIVIKAHGNKAGMSLYAQTIATI